MNSPIWEAASLIDDKIDQAKALIDQGEETQDPTMFAEARAVLESARAEAEFIMEQSKDGNPNVIVIDMAVSGWKDVLENTAKSYLTVEHPVETTGVLLPEHHPLPSGRTAG